MCYTMKCTVNLLVWHAGLLSVDDVMLLHHHDIFFLALFRLPKASKGGLETNGVELTKGTFDELTGAGSRSRHSNTT